LVDGSWKARAEFLLSVIELLFLSLTVEALQGKMCQNSLPLGMGRSLGAKISERRGRRSLRNIFGFYKTRYILLSNSANCTVLRAVVLTQYRRVTDRQTDRQTDGIAVASTALAMRELRRAVKTEMLRRNGPDDADFIVRLLYRHSYYSHCSHCLIVYFTMCIVRVYRNVNRLSVLGL